MIRLAIVVEGQTERTFTARILAPHLRNKRVFATPVLIGRARNIGSGGGHVTIERLVKDIRELYYKYDYVTTLVDFFGFRDRQGLSIDDVGARLAEAVTKDMPDWDARRVIPYVQRHEFEGLLFSDVEAFSRPPGVTSDIIAQLRRVRVRVSSPEDINDGATTHPSKRLLDMVPQYSKRADAQLLLQEMGLETVRHECPRFHTWMARLESLAVEKQV